MATGDQSDILGRIKGVLPPWFGPTTTFRDALLLGIANALAFAYSLYAYAKLQTRILTASDGWLDMISADYFGTGLPRTANQSDTSFRARIIINMFRERGTRNAISKVMTDLTGRAPVIFEPQRPMDTGAYGASNSGYGVAGGYGSQLIPYQAFVTVYRPLGSGIPSVAGYGSPSGGYGVASQADYASLASVLGALTDADLYNAVDSVKPAASIIWVRISA